MTLDFLKPLPWLILAAIWLNSCTSGKDIVYFQDVQDYKDAKISFKASTLQPNDILQITISAVIPETAVPYNRGGSANMNMINPQALNLLGYMVSLEGYITLPILGKIQVQGQSIVELEAALLSLLETGNHLLNPSVSVRLINAKVTVLGEVRNPGTFTFTEQNLSIPQVLGLAGDLNINGKRDDILLIRQLEDGAQMIGHIDLTTAAWMSNPDFSSVKPNDILVIQPNRARIKSAGFIGNISVLLSVATTLLSVAIILTR